MRGGVRLAPVETRLLTLFREHIPQTFHSALDAQLEAYNLVQRHVEWRGCTFYRIRAWRVFRDDLPVLPCNAGEVKLLSLAVSPAPDVTLHVVFWAVRRYFFGFASGESLKPYRDTTELRLLNVKQSWRSNVAAGHGTASEGRAA